MRNLLLFVLLIMAFTTILANPNAVIQINAKYNQLTGELITPDKSLLQRALKNYQKGYYESFLRDMKKASAFGNSEAQKYVGLSYIKSLGVSQDWAKGYAWIKLAALDGTSKHKKLKKTIFASLKLNEVKQAEKEYLLISKDYGTSQTKLRRKKWQQKQMKSSLGSRVGARTSSVRQTRILDSKTSNIELVVFNNETSLGLDDMLDFVVNYNFGLTGLTKPPAGIVTTGEIIPVEN